MSNLLAAGRNVSAEFHALGTIRIIACSMVMGQAAGTAAAMCAKEGIAPRDLDGVRVRAGPRSSRAYPGRGAGRHLGEAAEHARTASRWPSADFAVIVNEDGQSRTF